MSVRTKRILKWSVGVTLLVLFGWFQIAYWSSNNDCGRRPAAGAELMMAVKHCEYGKPDVLHVGEIEKPVPKDNEILVRVRAASLNAIDGQMITGVLIGRPLFGLRKPKITRFGRDFAGVVEAVGKDVTEFKAGDEVFGARIGAVAQYICIREERLAAKPGNVSFEQAGAVTHAGLTALQGLRAGQVRAGQKVLINGASGGVGTFALQIAKAFETEVTAVVSTRNVENARSLGADYVIDYTKEDFTKGEERYDLLYDNVGNRSFEERRRLLKPEGICVLAGIGSAGVHKGQMGRIAGTFITELRARFSDRKFARYITTGSKADLHFLRDLMAAGKLKPFVEKTYPMTAVAEAVRYLNEGHARGKLVITVE